VAVGAYPDGQIKHKCLSRGYTAWWQRKTYFSFLTAYILVVPAIVICFCYFNVVRVVWQQGKEVSTKEPGRIFVWGQYSGQGGLDEERHSAEKDSEERTLSHSHQDQDYQGW